jgi:hypothetical protein
MSILLILFFAPIVLLVGWVLAYLLVHAMFTSEFWVIVGAIIFIPLGLLVFAATR